MFIINLFVPAHGPAEVRSCEASGSKWSNKTSFSGTRALEDVFAPALAEGLYHLLKKVTPKARVLALPNRAIETVGLVLGGIHILANYSVDGSGMIVVRFKHLIGSVHNAFSAGFGMCNQVADARDELALGVLADLSLPLLDLCTFSEIDVVSGQMQSHPLFRALAQRADEIRFQVELIKRYVNGMEYARAAVANP